MEKELGIELGIELGKELGIELGIELGKELGIELGIELGKELEIELGIELGKELGIELGTCVCIPFFHLVEHRFQRRQLPLVEARDLHGGLGLVSVRTRSLKHGTFMSQ